MAPEVVLPRSRSTGEIIRRSVSYLRPHTRSAVTNIVCALLTLAFSFVFPQVTQYVIDDVIGSRKIYLLLPALGVLLVAYILRDVFDGLRIRINASFEQDVVFDMRRDIYARLQRLPIKFFDKHASGDLITRVMEDIAAVERLVIDGCELGVISLISVIAVGSILFVKNANLAFWAATPLPILVFGSYWYTRTSHARYRIQRQSAATANALLADNLQGIRQIKAFGQEDQENTRFAVYADGLRRRTLEVMNLWSIYSPTMNFFSSLGTVLVLGIGGPLVISGSMTLGKLVGFVFYLPLFYEPIGRLHRLNQMLQAARASSERVCEILDNTDEHAPRAGAHDLARPVRGDVRYENVSFSYGLGLDALKNITLHALPGQLIALVGPTGAGKTTLVNLLQAFYQGSSGKIQVDGQDIDGVTIASLRSAIGVVSQETFLFNGTIRENICFARPDATEESIMTACRAANCHEFIMRLPDGYNSRVGERGVRTQRRREAKNQHCASVAQRRATTHSRRGNGKCRHRD